MNKEIRSDKLSSLIKLSGIDQDELKRVFKGAVKTREGHLGLQRENI